MKDTRIVQPFISDVDDLYAFPSIKDMQKEVKAILGFDIKKILRVDRFEENGVPSVHFRHVADVNDGSGVPIEVNVSNDPRNPRILNKFANLVVGFTYWSAEKNNIVFWNGTSLSSMPKGIDIPENVAAPNGVDWNKFAVRINDETELTNSTKVKNGEFYFRIIPPTDEKAGGLAFYLISNIEPDSYKFTRTLDLQVEGLKGYEIIPWSYAFENGVPQEGDTGLYDINTTAGLIPTTELINNIQNNAINKKSICTTPSTAQAGQVVDALAFKMLHEHVHANSTQIVDGKEIFVTKDGVTKKYVAKRRDVIIYDFDTGTYDSNQNQDLKIPFTKVSGEDINLLKWLRTFEITVYGSNAPNVNSFFNGPIAHYGVDMYIKPATYIENGTNNTAYICISHSYITTLAIDGRHIIFALDITHGYVPVN